MVVTLVVFLIGRFQLLPSAFDQNGIGIAFAMDGTVYRGLISDMAETLRHRGISAWYNIQAPAHCRLLSITFVFPGTLVGYNILAAEPFHLLYYLAILVLVYFIAKNLFNSCVGLVAAGLIAVWPTFLLHSIQLIRDSLSIAFMLGLVLILVVVLQRTLSWAKLAAIGSSSIVLLILFWLTRGNFWNVVLAACLLTIVLLIVRAVRESKLLLTNFILLLTLLVGILLIPAYIESTTIKNVRPPTMVISIPVGQPTSRQSMLDRLVTQIRARRGGFSVYKAQASNIDSHVQFNNGWDVVKYLPRAAAIGFFAPFPRMWFESGTGGRVGRLVSGTETLAMYLLYIPALVCVWKERRNLSVWLMFLLTTIGVTALGLVVANAGALYRLRFVFWMMVIVLAAKVIADRLTNRSTC